MRLSSDDDFSFVLLFKSSLINGLRSRQIAKFLCDRLKLVIEQARKV